MTASIKRTLVRDGLDSGWHEIRQDEIDAIRGPAVILGDPGLGKTELAKWLGERPGMRHVPAGKFERHADPGSLINPGERIVIDGLDEVASAEPGGAVDAVLRQLSRAGNPTFILTCREADWQGAAARAKIEQDYATDPILLRLQPFSANDTYGFLSQEFPEINADELLDHLMEHGIWDLSGNPLTLRMLGEVARRTGRLPDSRTDLFDRACRVMLEERNQLHKGDPHARRAEDELLLAAGAICAAQLICDRAGV
ncbi:MAG: hypothetical protein OXI73_09795, partial [Rhodospirillales bacterium]|nr:hypothetical protein [Rhodospirillales bacterium]